MDLMYSRGVGAETQGSGAELMREGGWVPLTFDPLADVVVETGIVEGWRETQGSCAERMRARVGGH